MENKQELIYSFKAALRIIENTLSGKVPFKIVDFIDDNIGVYAIFEIDGELFYILPNKTGSKVWVSNLPIENTGISGLDSGYEGFPTEVAGVIEQYYREKPKGAFQTFDNIGDLGRVGLNEIIREEVRKVFEISDVTTEAEISSALGFMQDTKSSIDKLKTQNKLSVTGSGVDKHLTEAINQINKAISNYFKNLSPEVKSKVLSRIGEIKI